MNPKQIDWPHFGWKTTVSILALLFVASWADSGSILTGVLFLVGYVFFCLVINFAVGFCRGFWQSARN